jgi:hypothetical protein
MTPLAQLFENNSDCYADTGPEGPVVLAMTKDRFVEVVTKLTNICLAADLTIGDQFHQINNDHDHSEIHTVVKKIPSTIIFTSGGGHITFGIPPNHYVKLIQSANPTIKR